MELELKYHHIGIPTQEKREDEEYLAEFKVYISSFDRGPFGVEWLRFEDDSTSPDLLKRVPHVAFEVQDLEAAIAGKEVLVEPNSPSEGVRVAFIVDDGAPIEFLEFSEPRDS
jgi:hypothetical protein